MFGPGFLDLLVFSPYIIHTYIYIYYIIITIINSRYCRWSWHVVIWSFHLGVSVIFQVPVLQAQAEIKEATAFLNEDAQSLVCKR